MEKHERQRHHTFVGIREVLLTRATNAVGAGTATFLVPLLPFLARTKLRVYWEHDSGGAALGSARTDVGTATLWAAAATRGRLQGQYAATRNFVGTRAAPLTFFSSTDLGLWGMEFDVDTVGNDDDSDTDAQVYGSLAFTPSGSVLTAGRFTVEAIYQTLDRITDAEFERFRTRLRATVGRVDILT